MKKLYGLMGLTGFTMTLGGAGGADYTDFTVSALTMLSGILLLCLSMVLNKQYKLKCKKRRRMYLKKIDAVRTSKSTAYTENVCRLKPGISRIISEKRNSPELC